MKYYEKEARCQALVIWYFSSGPSGQMDARFPTHELPYLTQNQKST